MLFDQTIKKAKKKYARKNKGLRPTRSRQEPGFCILKYYAEIAQTKYAKKKKNNNNKTRAYEKPSGTWIFNIILEMMPKLQ